MNKIETWKELKQGLYGEFGLGTEEWVVRDGFREMRHTYKMNTYISEF